MASSRATRLALIVAAVVVVLDQGSKFLAVALLSGQGQVSVLGGLLHAQLYRNFAGPGGAFDGHIVLISLFTILAVVAIAVAATQVQTRLGAVAIGLLLGGGIGNMLDRLLRAPAPLHGGVVDWLQPTANGGSMNLADLSLNLAFVFAVLAGLHQWWRSRRDAGTTAPVQPAATPPRAGSSGASGR
jgi:signal peptidase II